MKWQSKMIRQIFLLSLILLALAFCPQGASAASAVTNAAVTGSAATSDSVTPQHTSSSHHTNSKTQHSKHTLRKRHLHTVHHHHVRKHLPNTTAPSMAQITGQPVAAVQTAVAPAPQVVLPVPKITGPDVTDATVPAASIVSVDPLPQIASATTSAANDDNSAPQRLVKTVYETLNTLSYSVYELGGTYFNALQGVYKVDCSNYVDHLLNLSVPNAYQSLLVKSGSPRPTSEDYFSFFRSLPTGTVDDDWYRIGDVSSLSAGDILVFRYKNLAGRDTAGHVMVVVGNPQPANEAGTTYLVRVADSAPSGHTDDTRPAHTSGIGIGTLLLKVRSSTGAPYAYAWKDGSPWKYNMDFAMARPVVVG